MNAAALLQQTLEARLRGEPEFEKLARALGVTAGGLVSMIVHLSLFPDDTPQDLTPRGKQLLTSSELAKYVKLAVESARQSAPAMFAEVKKAQLAITQPGDPRTGDPALKAELDKLLKRVR